MDDIIAEFLAETNESLTELDNSILTLEQNPNDPALISKIFRIIHTIKGTCGFLGLPGSNGLPTRRRMFWACFAMASWT